MSILFFTLHIFLTSSLVNCLPQSKQLKNLPTSCGAPSREVKFLHPLQLKSHLTFYGHPFNDVNWLWCAEEERRDGLDREGQRRRP